MCAKVREVEPFYEYAANTSGLGLGSLKKLFEFLPKDKLIVSWFCYDGAIPVYGTLNLYNVVGIHPAQNQLAKMAALCRKLNFQKPMVLCEEPYDTYPEGHLKCIVGELRQQSRKDNISLVRRANKIFNGAAKALAIDGQLFVVYRSIDYIQFDVHLVAMGQSVGLRCDMLTELPDGERMARFVPDPEILTPENKCRQWVRLFDSLFFEYCIGFDKVFSRAFLDFENGVDMGEISLRIAGLTMSKKSRMFSAWIVSQVKKGKTPKIKLKYSPYGHKDDENYDPNAVKVLVYYPPKKSWYHLGWIPKKENGRKIPPNQFVAKLLIMDQEFDAGIIQKVWLENFGSSIVEGGKLIYYGRVAIRCNVENMRKIKK